VNEEPPARSKTPRAEIERVDQEGFHGWVVTVWKKGKEHKRRFAEGSYASPAAAFAAGVRFRNRIVSGAGAAAGPSKGGTGIPGISVGSVRTTSGRYVKHYKSSVYGADGKRRGLVFSWLKHGKERALELAKKALREGRAEARRARRLLKKKKKTPTRTDDEARLKSVFRCRNPLSTKTFGGWTTTSSAATSWSFGGWDHATRNTSATESAAVAALRSLELSSTATRSSRSFPHPSGSIGGPRTLRASPESRWSTLARDPAASSRGSQLPGPTPKGAAR
jgi:hypothetical protein